MRGDLQAIIKPHTSPNSLDLQPGAKTRTTTVQDSVENNKTSFKDLLLNSNADIARERSAQKNGDLSGAKSDEEFLKMLSDQSKKATGQLREPKNELDKDAFLKLFITQIRNQDPLNPDDSAKMAAQLAHFQSLEQMQNVNTSLAEMRKEQAMGRAVNLIDFVGKEVQLEGGKLRLENGKLTDATFSLEKPVANAELEVRNSAGAIVARQDLGNLAPGEHQLQWNGLDPEGKKVNDGVFTFAVVAKDMNGTDVPATVTSAVKITGVDLQSEGGSFFTELGPVGIAEVAKVGNAGFAKIASVKKAAEKAAEKANGADPNGADPKGTDTAGVTPEDSAGNPADPDTAPNIPENAEAAQAAPTAAASAESVRQTSAQDPRQRSAAGIEVPVAG